MPWVIFIKDFDWNPPEKKGTITICFKTGMKVFVRRKCAEDAKSAGVVITEGEDDGIGCHLS